MIECLVIECPNSCNSVCPRTVGVAMTAADRPPDVVAQFRLAESLVSERRPLDALRELAPVLDAEPNAPSVQLLAGRAYLQSAQLNRAEEAFLRVLEHNPSDHYARFALGRTLQRQSRLEEARAQLAMAVAMNPTPDYQEALNEVRMRIAGR
jgi:Flp pilus assembly protein TadD